MTSQGLDVLDEAECFALLGSRTLGRVGVRIADDFVIFPVYYTVVDNAVVLRTSPGTKLSAAILGTRVVFEVDSASPGWSVLVRGHAHEIREHDEQVRTRDLLGDDWPADPRHFYVRIPVEKVTGRRLSSRSD